MAAVVRVRIVPDVAIAVCVCGGAVTVEMRRVTCVRAAAPLRDIAVRTGAAVARQLRVLRVARLRRLRLRATGSVRVVGGVDWCHARNLSR
jgi:hypothetical protein